MKCTYRAAELLKGKQELKVHSVYRHTVNIIVNGRILAFHCDAIPSTPLSLALPFSEEEFEYFEQEAQRTGVVNLCCCWISTGNFKRNVGQIILWDDRLNKQDRLKKLNLNQKDKNMEDDILSVLLPVLIQNYQLGGFSDCAVTTEKRKDDSFITQILREKTAVILSKDILEDKLGHKDALKAANKLEGKDISEGCETDFEKQICTLIGLGPGLTPSGDDFLTGILLAFSLQKNIRTYIKTDVEKNIRVKADRERAIAKEKERNKKQKQICKVVSENLDRTNDISKEYLLCAMENRFGELYHKLQEELYHGNVSEDVFRRIIHTGHSSGLDTLNGLAVGLKMIKIIGKDEKR